ncbi:hypothetical protein [Amycolatopsis taiwanensis]|uniref:Uncharacterized protein n=2 Tax=Amycolatopsis taiwanensis TaxID=342230 RepID=A0A9W6VCR0_9PSEU|nr:hypothetical protein [Amycolatopsis taiwanensis]GLY64010.1 hypothetical protein Atai01_06290 [Amycolatopsis taiwanensis]
MTFFGTDHWARLNLTLKGTDTTKSPDEIVNYPTELVSAKLAGGPAAAGQATRNYGAPYDFAHRHARSSKQPISPIRSTSPNWAGSRRSTISASGS